jgi:(E)-4-hydroxy-3-methylbut-2-enyl-diphosphate synthase
MNKIIVKAGNVTFGGDNPIVVQTMCNTPTQDIDASFEQCLRLSKAGAQLIRLTTQGMKEVAALKIIKERLRDAGIETPLSADVHFTSDVAIAAAEVADKVRINPGNFARDHETAREQFRRLTEVCRERNCAIRIGVNHGSLGERIIDKYGDSPLGMKESALEWINMAQEFNFDQIIVSLKASNTRVMTDAYRLLYKEFERMGVAYPLHLGVTEAGNGESGRIKSAVGLATLLSDGIGDTIRVSLTEDPQKEIPVASYIASYFSGRKRNFIIPNIYRKGSEPAVIEASYSEQDWQSFILRAACDLGPLMLDNIADDVTLKVTIGGSAAKDEDISRFRDELLQASRRKFTKPEYIACPGCGRTLFDLETVFEEVKKRTSHLKGYNIAVMGCVVNGPGEMADADYGYVGEGRNKVSIYRGKTPVYRSVPQDEAIDKLLSLIEEDARNKVFRPRLG